MSGTILTLGVYDTTEESFFRALEELEVDVFVDLRARRGLRGRKYAYANSTRLQERLAELNIDYIHLKDLAPTQSVRDVQRQVDEEAGVAKRSRNGLSPEFQSAYRREILGQADLDALEGTLSEWKRPALFCVEAAPEACHRSLVADALEERGWKVVHWTPKRSSS